MTTVDVDELIGAALGEDAALARAVELAGRNRVAGQLPFAALVVRDGKVIGAGVNTAMADLDPSAHGEVTAIRDAARRLGTLDLSGAVVYSSCEPCAICRLVAAASGVSEIVFAAPKESVPAWIDGDPATTARLIDAVTAVLPGIARRGDSGVDAAGAFGGGR
ncbi:nucleoside deaminase [Nucisporomicrobium flavum]|uniref:nucleoside deaminase n=1 Tax=Nucisporomicrobium flavum TaxID=2785915 RepID=UPI0018F660AA|nr:nucleoside deaminase [Nucisporomicrobium flavum]